MLRAYAVPWDFTMHLERFTPRVIPLISDKVISKHKVYAFYVSIFECTLAFMKGQERLCLTFKHYPILKVYF